jgi:DNA-binding PadR family transcriptional regulator
MVQRPSERLKRKIEKENLWLFILSALQKKRRYGNELRELVKNNFDFLIGFMTSYKVLYLLETGGYVISKKEGRNVYYEITKKGINELKEGKKFLKSYSEMI